MSLPDLSALTLDVGMPGSKRKACAGASSDPPEEEGELQWNDIDLVPFDVHPYRTEEWKEHLRIAREHQLTTLPAAQVAAMSEEEKKTIPDWMLEEEKEKIVTPYSIVPFTKNGGKNVHIPYTAHHRMAWSGLMDEDGIPNGVGQLWRIGDVTQSPLLKRPGMSGKKSHTWWGDFVNQDKSYGEAYHFTGTLNERGQPTGKGTLKLFWADLMDPSEWSTRRVSKAKGKDPSSLSAASRSTTLPFIPPSEKMQERAHFLTFQGEFEEGYAVDGRYTHLKPSDFCFSPGRRETEIKDFDWRLIGYQSDYLNNSIINRDLRAVANKKMDYYVTSQASVPDDASATDPLPYYRDITSIQLMGRRNVTWMKREGDLSIQKIGGVRLSVVGKVRIERVGKERQPDLNKRLVLDMDVRTTERGSSAPMLVLYNSANMLQVLHARKEEWNESTYAVRDGVVSNKLVNGEPRWTSRTLHIEGEPYEDGFDANMTLGAGMYGYGQSAGAPLSKRTVKGCFWDNQLEGPGEQQSGRAQTTGPRVYHKGKAVRVYKQGGSDSAVPSKYHNQLPNYFKTTNRVSKPVLKMFQAIDPTQLSGGADMRWHSDWSRSLRPLAIYDIKNESLATQYRASKEGFKRVCPVPLGKVCARTEKPFGDLSAELGLDSTINEKFVFHGANLASCLSIAQHGFRYHPNGIGLYGNGTYFADDVTKCNQYSMPLTIQQAKDYLFVAETADEILARPWFGRSDGLFDLYDNSIDPRTKEPVSKKAPQRHALPGQYTSIYPMLLCRVVLGCAATVSLKSFMQNETHVPDPTDPKKRLQGLPIFDSGRNRDLITKASGRNAPAYRGWGANDLKEHPWNSVVTSYVSENPSTGNKYRYREFVLYNNAMILPTHLVFYVRHNAIDPGALDAAYSLGNEDDPEYGDPLYCRE